MALDRLTENPVLPYRREMIVKGGAALADYLAELIQKLQERHLYEVNRYINHLRGWEHASDYTKLDCGDAYAGSVATAAVAANAITNVQSAYTQASTYIGDEESIEQTLPFTTTGGTMILLWGAGVVYDTAPVAVKLRLYRGSGPLPLVEQGPLLTVSGSVPTLASCYVEAPAAAALTYTLRAIVTDPPGGVAWINNRFIVGLECKR